MRARTITLLSGALALLTISAPAAGPSSHQLRVAENNYKFAQKALKAGNISKARVYFDKALKALPSFPEARLGMGHIAMGEKRYPDALREYEMARDGYANLGDLLFDLELLRFMESQDQIAKLRDRAMYYRSLLRTSGAINMNTSLVEREITQIEEEMHQLELIRMPARGTPVQPPGELYFYLGNALFHVGRLDEALAAWEDCTRRAPRFPLVYNNLAVAYWKKNRIDDALGVVNRAETMGLAFNPALKADLQRTSAQRAAEATLQR